MQLPSVLKSRRFWTGIVGVVMMAAVQFIPGLAEHVDLLTNAILVLIALLIGGYSLEDAVLAYTKPEATAQKLNGK